jgi:hypothetical protein
MAGLVGITLQPDLTPVAAEAGAAEGDPRPIYTWAGSSGGVLGFVSSYLPSDGGAPRLVAVGGDHAALGVWDTGTGAFLGALPCPPGLETVFTLLTYQRPSDGRPRIAAGLDGGLLCIWDGDDLQLLHTIVAGAEGSEVGCLAVYEEPKSGRTRLVTG